MDKLPVFPLELIDITKRYHPQAGKPALALDHVSLAVPAGQIVGLVGCNGAGKTTLLRIAAGVQRPTRGEARIYGQPSGATSSSHVRAALPGRRLINPRRSLLENLPANDPHPEWTARLLQALALDNSQREKVCTLPQTWQNRAALACVLLSGAGVILLDELPILDPLTVQLLHNWLPDWAHTLDRTIVVATCQPAIALSLSDRLAVLRRGRLVFDGSPQALEGASEKISVRVRVSCRLDSERSSWFQGLSTVIDGSDTLIWGEIEDDAALYGLVALVRRLGLPLVSMERLNLSVEQRLQQLMD